MIDASQVHEWNDIHLQFARLYRHDKQKFNMALMNAARVFNRKIDRNIAEIERIRKQMEPSHTDQSVEDSMLDRLEGLLA